MKKKKKKTFQISFTGIATFPTGQKIKPHTQIFKNKGRRLFSPFVVQRWQVINQSQEPVATKIKEKGNL